MGISRTNGALAVATQPRPRGTRGARPTRRGRLPPGDGLRSLRDGDFDTEHPGLARHGLKGRARPTGCVDILPGVCAGIAAETLCQRRVAQSPR